MAVTDSLADLARLLEQRRGILPSLLMIVAIILVMGAFFQIDGTTVHSRDVVQVPALTVGGIIFLVALILLIRERPIQEFRTIVFYAPSIKANSFFAELLEYMVEMVHQRKWRFVIEKGESGVGMHEAGNYLDVIRRHADGKTILVMIPPSPRSFERIWHLPSDLQARLITLDMEVPSERAQETWPHQLKSVILVDNERGAQLAADEITNHCRTCGLDLINLVVCEGDFHDRGHHFRRYIETEARKDGLTLRFLGAERSLSFSQAIRESSSYIKETVERSFGALSECETFIFCANDNLSIGARLALSGLPTQVAAAIRPVRILCFDASATVRAHIDLGDRFLWRAVDQNYQRIVQCAVEVASDIFDDRTVTSRQILVEPSVYRF